jgi:molybdopterin synthase catalytic subunit
VPVALTSRRLEPGKAYRALDHREAGGVVVFVGRVRPDRSTGGVVRALFYEADRPMAVRALTELARTAERAPGVRRVLVWHRTGTIRVGEVAVIVGAAAVHRAEAFRAARFLIERVKRDVAIWKSDRTRPATNPRAGSVARTRRRSTGVPP